MIEPMSDTSLAADPGDGQSTSDDVVAQLTVDARGTRICTLYPADASGLDLVTTWITAREGSFVSRENAR